MKTADQPPATLWRRLCRSACRELGAKDAAAAVLTAVLVGAMALQLGLAGTGPRAGDEPPTASLRS